MIRLGDLIELQRGHDLPEAERREGTVPVIGSAGITGYHDTVKAPGPGVTIGRSGASFGKTTFVPTPYWPHNACLYVKNFKGNEVRFIAYLLENIDFSHLNSGAAQQSLNRNYLYPVEVPGFALPLQRRIASILSAYDDLIENHRKRIAILEDMARRLYREWFVHFRYPGHESVPLVDSPLGRIPQGWSCSCISEIVKRHTPGKIFQKDETLSCGTIPVYDQSTDEVVGYHEGRPGITASLERPIGMFGDHTCKLQLLVTSCSIGPNVVTFVVERELPMAFLCHAMIGLITTQEYKRHWTQLGAKSIVIPASPLTRRFSDFVLPNVQLQETLKLLIRNLRRTRDLLLPRLMSGTLSVEALATAEAAVS